MNPNSADSSARVFSPDSDAIATRALNSALCCFLFTPTSHVLWTGQPLAYPAVQKSGAAAFYEQWAKGQGCTRTKKTAYDIPRISSAFLEKERLRLGDLMFRQEYLCEFIDPGSAAFSSELIEACLADFDPFP